MPASAEKKRSSGVKKADVARLVPMATPSGTAMTMPIAVPSAMRTRLAPMWRINVPSAIDSMPALTTGSIAGNTRGVTSKPRTTASQITSNASNGRVNAAAEAKRPVLMRGRGP
jgi:hypothetical protein